MQEEEHIQGSLEIIYSLQEELKEITGMDEVTLQPAAGAHGEWTALMIFKAYHENNGQGHRDEVIVPDSAHGTKPCFPHLPDLNQSLLNLMSAEK